MSTPILATGGVQVISVAASSGIKSYSVELAKRADRIRQGLVDPEVDNLLILDAARTCSSSISTRSIGAKSTYLGRQGLDWAMSAVVFEKVILAHVRLRLTSGRDDGKMTAR